VEQSIETMVNRITSILSKNCPSIFLFGSVVIDDFKLGWSDIDFICLTDNMIRQNQADELVALRQTLMAEHPGNPYFRLFEGAMLTLDAFLQGIDDTVVYWGTSGQRLTNRHRLCAFSTMELLENGRILCGNDFRHLIAHPTRAEIIEAIKQHYGTIRQHGNSGGGWLLDIARCLYTLQTGKIISKTKAGEWVIEQNLCPDIATMKKIVEIRKNPYELKDSEEVIEWQKTLRPHIQRFADVLEAKLANNNQI